MRSKSERGKIAIGLVGAGPVWDQRYREVVSRLSDRIAVRAVVDSVLSRAQHVAAELNAEAVGGLTALFERPEIQGILVLDPAWFGVFPLRLGCRFHKPVFLAESPRFGLTLLQELEQQSRDSGATIMVEFARRHEPATNRLRELMATRLGSARRIEVELPVSNDENAPAGIGFSGAAVAAWLDWCGYVAGWSPLQIRVESACPSSLHDSGFLRSTPKVTVTFGRRGRDSDQVTAELRFRPDLPAHSVRRMVGCDHGEAELTGAERICWKNGASGGSESLENEKSAAEVTLHQFCRRVAGGLLPVAGLPDVARGLRLADAIRRSAAENQAISLEP
jgi:predicted dehydrogenase